MCLVCVCVCVCASTSYRVRRCRRACKHVVVPGSTSRGMMGVRAGRSKHFAHQLIRSLTGTNKAPAAPPGSPAFLPSTRPPGRPAGRPTGDVHRDRRIGVCRWSRRRSGIPHTMTTTTCGSRGIVLICYRLDGPFNTNNETFDASMDSDRAGGQRERRRRRVWDRRALDRAPRWRRNPRFNASQRKTASLGCPSDNM